jgi:hypothetical protein
VFNEKCELAAVFSEIKKEPGNISIITPNHKITKKLL